MQRRGPGELIAEADKKMNPGWWDRLTAGATRFDDAADLYTKAANLYKKDKNWEDGGRCSIKAAQAYLQAQSPHEAANSYVNAAACFKQCDVKDAISMLEKAVDLYTDAGRFGLAGRHQKEIAELLEAEGDKDGAIKFYQAAADTFEGENNESANVKNCLLKVASISADNEDFEKAVELFEKAAEMSLEGLSKWSVKDYLFKAGLCKLATRDLVAMRQALDKYKDMYLPFQRERECKLLEDLTTACENFDSESFTAALIEFDSITQLDQWKAGILAKVKKGLGGGGEDGTDLGDGDLEDLQ